MAILSLHHSDGKTYTLWSENNKHQPDQVATVIRRIQNHVYLANLVTTNHPHPTVQTVALKIAYDNEALNLKKEAGFYENELIRLQGTVVPRCLGYFRGQLTEGITGCLLLEHCQGTIEKDMAEFGRLIMVACCQLHQAGVVHGDLLDGRHVVKMGHGIRIVDFSRAYTHECRNAVPTLTSCKFQPDVLGCMELSSLEQTFGALDYPVNKPLTSIHSMKSRIFKRK